MAIRRFLAVALVLLPVMALLPAGCVDGEVDWPAAALAGLPSRGDDPAGGLSPVVAETSTPTSEALPASAGTGSTAFSATDTPQPTATDVALTATATAAQTTAAPTRTPAATPIASPPHPTTGAPIATHTHIGDSAGGRPINSYRLGRGPTAIVLVGGMHGGYEWNSIVLAQALLAYFETAPQAIPASISLYVVPNANPDGLTVVTGDDIADRQLQPSDIITHTAAGRFNANGVDLNRNWDCLWQEQAFWRDQVISAGAYPFSEPETAALSRYFLQLQPAVVIFLHSMAGAVFSSGCPEMDRDSGALATVYGLAAGYPVYSSFDYYPITGDAGDWLTTQGIPSFTIELSTHEGIDWEQNLAGFQAVLEVLHNAADLEPEVGQYDE